MSNFIPLKTIDVATLTASRVMLDWYEVPDDIDTVCVFLNSDNDNAVPVVASVEMTCGEGSYSDESTVEDQGGGKTVRPGKQVTFICGPDRVHSHLRVVCRPSDNQSSVTVSGGVYGLPRLRR